MKIFENAKNGTTYRSKSSCSYCRSTDHNVNTCPRVQEDWKVWKTFVVPMASTTLLTCPYLKSPKYWGEWYERCRTAVDKQAYYQAKQKLPTQRSKRAAPSCGFCGDKSHNRKKCPTLSKFLSDSYSANANWRRKAYDTLVNGMGISVGAVIHVARRNQWSWDTSESPKKVAIVTKVNFEELNVMAALETGWNNHEYRCALVVNVMVDGHERTISFKTDQEGLVGVFASGAISNYSSWQYVNCVAKSPKPLDESWVTDYKEAFDFLGKKRSLKKLKELEIVDLIDKWSS